MSTDKNLKNNKSCFKLFTFALSCCFALNAQVNFISGQVVNGSALQPER